MKNILAFALLYCAGCSASINQPANEVSTIPVVSSSAPSAVINNPCYRSQKEQDDIVKLELSIRSYTSNPDEAEKLISAARNDLNKRVIERCDKAKEEERVRQEAAKKEREENIKKYWGMKKPAEDYAEYGEDDLSNFWCRDNDKSCFITEGECQISGDELFECMHRSLASCVYYTSASGNSHLTSCFSTTASCEAFCDKRKESYEGKFSCLDRCKTFNSDSYEKFVDRAESNKESYKAGF